jgi:cobalt transporter subunit CbtB
MPKPIIADSYKLEEKMVDKVAVSGVERSDARAGYRIRTGTAYNAIVAAMFGVALGATIVFVVGFSHSDLLHAAAHDVRHAAGFPCH